ncbi:MAG: PKD domain-containing protein, partial [Actinobacteria bacterium]
MGDRVHVRVLCAIVVVLVTATASAVNLAAAEAATTTPTFRSLTSANTGPNHIASLTITVPSTVVDGDVLLLLFESSNAADPTGLGGWTKIDSGDAGSSLRGQSFYRIANHEPASYTLTYSTAIHINAVMMDYSGVDTTSPISAHGVVSLDNYVQSIASPSMTGVGQNDLSIIAYHARGVPVGVWTFTPPSGWIERIQGTTNSPDNPDVGSSIVQKVGSGGSPNETTSIQVTYVTTALALRASGDSAPVARLAVSPTSGQAPLPVTADASTSTDTDATPIATYAFDFGDGSAVVGPQTGSSAQHTYSSAGTYTVKVTVADTGGLASSATAQVQVTSSPVDQAPVARLAVSPTSGQAPLPVTADASTSTDTDATPIATYAFDFGDGSAVVGPQTGSSAQHTYSSAGTYTVKVTV